MNLQRRRPGVTGIVVIVILVAIVAIAFPRWRSHQVANHIETALKAADGAKVAVVEAATVQGGIKRVKADGLGYNHAATGNPYVARIDIADGGVITILTKNTGAAPDPQLLLVPIQGGDINQAPISWRCSTSVGDTAASPANCRDTIPPAIPAPASPATRAGASTALAPERSS